MAVVQAPVADAGTDAVFTDTEGNGEHQVQLDGTGSTDPDGTIQIYRWTEDAAVVAGGATATPTLPVGIHQITLEVVDDDGASDTDQVTITVEELPENAPPVADAGPDFSVTDADGSGDPSPGDTVRYTLHLENTGDEAAAYYVCMKTGNHGKDGEPFFG